LRFRWLRSWRIVPIRPPVGDDAAVWPDFAVRIDTAGGVESFGRMRSPRLGAIFCWPWWPADSPVSAAGVSAGGPRSRIRAGPRGRRYLGVDVLARSLMTRSRPQSRARRPSPATRPAGCVVRQGEFCLTETVLSPSVTRTRRCRVEAAYPRQMGDRTSRRSARRAEGRRA